MSVAYAHPPRWLGAEQLRPAIPAGVADWLFDSGSLTQRLTALSAGTFGVSVLQEGWLPLRDDECAIFDVDRSSQGWVREVFLFGEEQPWVFARSVALRSELEGSDLVLHGLGSRPLGELLFSQKNFQRGAIQATRYPSEWLPVATRSEGLWCRRSCFQHDALGVLVAEVFLPAFWQRLRVDPDAL